MCNSACLDFEKEFISADEITGKRVVDVGSYDVNGSFRYWVREFNPSAWVGVDLQPCNHEHASGGPCVTEICCASRLLERFGAESFDCVMSGEMLEHVADWKSVIHNLKGILKPGGSLMLTTRSPGFPRHDWPDDYWRFSCADMAEIFRDFDLQAVRPDPRYPGVFVMARKPSNFTEADLSSYEVFSMNDLESTGGAPTDRPRKRKLARLRSAPEASGAGTADEVKQTMKRRIRRLKGRIRKLESDLAAEQARARELEARLGLPSE